MVVLMCMLCARACVHGDACRAHIGVDMDMCTGMHIGMGMDMFAQLLSLMDELM